MAVIALMLALSVVPSAGGTAGASDLPPGPVYVHFHGCPFPVESNVTDSYEYLTGVCNEPAWYVTFSLTTEGVTYKGQWIGSDPRDQVFASVPAHIFSLEGQITPYSSQPIVYCQGGDGGPSGEYARMQVFAGNGYVIHPKLGPIGYVVCDWFASAPDPAVEAKSSVAIDVHLCPDGYDLAAADHNSLPVDCDETQNGIPFAVESYRNTRQDQSTGDVVTGGVYFQFLLPDFVQITADGSGYLTPRVFCRGDLTNGDLPTSEFPANGATFAYNLLDGEQLICDWYIAPVTSTIKIDLKTKQTDDQDAQGDTETGNGSDGAGNATAGDDDSADTGDVDTGNATNGGTGNATEGNATGNGTAGTGDDETDDTGTDETGAGNATDQGEETGQGDAGEDTVPVEYAPGTGAVLVTVHTCPATFDAASASDGDLAGNCGGDGNGFGFTLTTEGQSFPQTSGQAGNGQARWDNVPAHILTIAESIPGGYGTPIVVCDGQRLDASGGAIHPTVSEGVTLSCDWYNVQA